MGIQKKLRVKLSKNIIFLYINRLLIQTAFGLLTGFGLLFFYEEFGESIPAVLGLFALMHILFMVFNHFAARLLGKVGMKKMMIFAVFSLAVMFISRVFWDYSPLITLIVYILAFTGYKTLYWVPYHVEFATFTDLKNRGKQTAFLYNIGALLAAALPFIGGFALSLFGYNVLFISSFIFALLSIWPLFHIHETQENYTWSLKKLFSEFFDQANRAVVRSSLGNGMQTAVAGVIWPIFIFITVGEDYVKFGAILAIVAVTLMGLRWFVGTCLDKFGRKKVLKFGNTVYFTGWIFKMFIETTMGVFITDVYHKLGGMINNISFTVTTYDQAFDSGHYIDEYTVVRECSFLFGYALMAAVLIPVVIVLGIKAAFFLGALASLLMIQISKKSIVQ